MHKFLIPGLSIALLCSSCGHNGGDTGKAAAEYRTIIVTTSDQTLKTAYSATLEGRQLVEIRPQISGVITDIRINEGDRVRKGQTLFVIDQIPYKAAVEVAKANVGSAEAALATAELTEKSNRQLYERGVISEYELQTAVNALAQARASLAQAQAQLTTASNNLSYTEIKSPVNGSAGMIAYRVGALVSSNIATPLVTVSDDSTVYAYFSMSENKMLSLMGEYSSQEDMLAGMPTVGLVLSNGTEYPTEGRIDAISGIIESGTGAVRIRAAFANSGHILRSGGSGSVIVPTDKQGVIVIPQSATYEIQEKTFAYKVVDGKAKSVEVKVYKTNDGRNYIVEDGLAVGDVIIAEGAGLVREGTPVKVAEGR